MQKCGNGETTQIRQIRLYSQQTIHSILFNSTLITLRRNLLASRLLSLSVLNLTTHLQYSQNHLRKSGLLGLLGDLLSLVSLLLNIGNGHTDNGSLHLEGLLAAALALLSSLQN